MKIKVPFFASKVRSDYAKVIAVLSAISSFYFIAIDVPESERIMYLIIASIILILVYLTVWFAANLKRRAKLNINNSTLIIQVGDIFQQAGLKAIAFNEYFDTIVDDVVISRASLNGKYISKLTSLEITDLDNKISTDSRLQDRESGSNPSRTHGKKIKYKLGSIFVNGEYILTAFSHFDENNRAVLSLKEYIACMLNLWEEIDQVYAGRSVAVPLMGSGITRFKDADVRPQELLAILIWTFKVSRIKFTHPANAIIVIHDSLADKINLYGLDK